MIKVKEIWPVYFVMFCKKNLSQTSLGTRNVWMFWTTFVFMCKLKSDSLSYYLSHVIFHIAHITCQMSKAKCLFWSLVHAEQHLFSCLGSKVTVYSRKLQCFYFWDSLIKITLSCEFRYHRAGSQLKMLLTTCLCLSHSL